MAAQREPPTDLRHEYIELMAETKEEKKKPAESSLALYHLYEKTNTLLGAVRTSPELRLDACVSGEVVELYSRQLAKLCSGAALSVAQLVALMKNPENQLAAARYAESLFRGARFPPRLELRAAEIPPRRAVKRRGAEGQLEKPAAEQDQALQQTDAPQQIKKIFQVLQTVGSIELLKLVINPRDFAKTVENLLYLSFAVKLERAFVTERHGVLFVSRTRQEDSPSAAFILTISPADQARAIAELAIDRPLLD